MFVKLYVYQKIIDFSGSLMFWKKLRYSFFFFYIGLHIMNKDIDCN